MRKKSRALLAGGLVAAGTLLSAVSPSIATAKKPLQINDLFKFHRISDAQIAPHGEYVAYVVTIPNKEANTSNSDIWLVSTKTGETRQITFSPKADNSPRWSPDGKKLSFISTRSGSPQVFVIDLATGGEARQVSNISTGVDKQKFSPDGTMISFVSKVYPEYSSKPFAESNKLNRERDEAQEKSKVKAQVFDQLLYRHWDEWTDFKRFHIFVQPLAGGDAKDVTPGERDAVPNSSTFSAGDDYDWSPDSKEIAYTATPTPIREEAWLTDHDIYTVNISSGQSKQITTNKAADGYPRYSPDGKYLAWRAQSKPGYEADKWDIILMNRSNGSIENITKSWDIVAQQFEWSSDSKTLYFLGEEDAETLLWSIDTKGNSRKKISDIGMNGSISVAQNGFISCVRSTLQHPNEVFLSKNGDEKSAQALTKQNETLLNEIEFGKAEKIYYQGAKVKNQGWFITPPNFDPNKKYPMIILIHGGPQGAWENSWSFRWNQQLWAAQGYVIFSPNPTGSTGFGQKFTDDISGNWGSDCYTDIMKGFDYVTKTYSFIDKNRVGAAGGSFGGYMVNWIAGHSDKFKALVTHCGVYNFTSMYGTTDEIWFDDWEHKGAPWEKPGEYDKYSPHMFAKNFKTPTLVIQGNLDFRVPLQEGLQMFTALQKQNVPSRLLYFPDEGHWVLKHQNVDLWLTTIYDWMKKYLQ